MKANLTETEINQIKNLFEKIKEENDFESDENYESFLNTLDDSVFEDLDEDTYRMFNTKILKFKKVNSDAIIPEYNYPTDSGFDFYSTENITIPPLGRKLIPTGLSVEFDEGLELQVRTKSGLAINQGLMVLNSPGTVDQGYRGEIKVPLFNVNPHEITINKGMKIAQGVICPVIHGRNIKIEEVSNLNEADRGSNGFGSTGL